MFASVYGDLSELEQQEMIVGSRLCVVLAYRVSLGAQMNTGTR